MLILSNRIRNRLYRNINSIWNSPSFSLFVTLCMGLDVDLKHAIFLYVERTATRGTGSYITKTQHVFTALFKLLYYQILSHQCIYTPKCYYSTAYLYGTLLRCIVF